MTTATKITLVRLALIPVFMVMTYASRSAHWAQYVAFAVFLIASLSDFADGQIARRCHQVTVMGKFLDPLADKLLVISAMVMFCQWEVFPAWALMLVLAREFAVTGLRLIAVGNGVVIAAGWSGKIKTAATMIGLCFMLVFWRGYSFSPILNTLVVWVITLTTLYSGVEYFVKNWRCLLDRQKPE